MKISIIFCHYKVGKMSAYVVSQLLKYKGNHEIEILISDNNSGDGSIEYLNSFKEHIKVFDYPKNIIQSHGCGYDFLLPHISNDYFIALESDSYPTEDNWLDLYSNIIKCGYDGAGSLLRLSGGEYMHPAGALYKTSIWKEAKEYCDNIQYRYLPNIAMKEGFPCHLMVHDRIFAEFSKAPEKFVELHYSYGNHTPLTITNKAIGYDPVTKPFHSGLGQFQEAFSTYGQRNIKSEPPGILLKNDVDLIYRMGMEPGQWFHYWMLAVGKKLFYIPTKTVWMPNRIDQQQEYTITDAGLRHEWGVSAYNGCTAQDVQDIVKFKEKRVDDLYASIQKSPA